MARSPIEIGIASETRAFRQGVESGIIRPLEDAEQALEQLAKTDAGRGIEQELEQAQKATRDLKNETRRTADGIEDAFRKGYRDVNNQTRKTTEDIEDRFRKSTRKASEDVDQSTDRMKAGFRDAGEEASQSAREGAASFTGEFDDVADFVQETLANALGGFGPLGAAAGLAMALGLGVAVQKVTELSDMVDDLQQQANDIHLGALEEGLSVEAYITGVTAVADALQRLNEEGQKQFRWFWEEDSTALQEFVRDLRSAGEEQANANDIFGLGTDELRSYRDELRRNADAYGEQADAIRDTERGMGTLTDADRRRISALDDQRDAAGRVIETLEREIETRSEATERSNAWAESGAAAAVERAEAEQQAADDRAAAEEAAANRITAAVQSVENEQLSAYDSMRQAAYEKATADDQAFDIDRWLTYVEEARGAADAYRANIQQMQLTPDEWSNLLAMPEEARTAIVNSYATTGDEGRARIRQALGDGGAGEAGAEAAVSFDESFNPKAEIEPSVDTTKATALVDKLVEPRELKVKIKVDSSEIDNWTPPTKRGRVVVDVDKAPWNDWRPAQKKGKVYWE